MRKLIATLMIVGGLAASGFAATPAKTASAEDGTTINSTASTDQNYDQSTTCPANDSQGDPEAPQNYVEYGAGG